MSKTIKNFIALVSVSCIASFTLPNYIQAQGNNNSQVSIKEETTLADQTEETTTLETSTSLSEESESETQEADSAAKTQKTIPNEFVGIWQFGYQGKPFAVTTTSIFLNGKLYDVTNVKVTEVNDKIGISVEWDAKKFAKNYGDDAVVIDGPFKWVYDNTMDTVTGSYVYYRQMDREFIDQVKASLLKEQPINEEQLNKVMYNSINAYNTIADGLDISKDEYNQYIYEWIAKEYPNLKLLTGDNYDAYLKASEQLSDFSLADLNKANPANVLKLFNDASKKNNGDQAKIIAAIKPKIQAAIKEYDKRLADSEKKKEKTDSPKANDSTKENNSTKEEDSSKDKTKSEDENLTGVKAEAVEAVKVAYPNMAGDTINYIVSTDSESDDFIIVEVYQKANDKLNLLGIFNYDSIDQVVKQVQ